MPFRERKVFRTASKSAAQRWGQDRERHLLLHGLPKPMKEVPTLEEFAPRFMDGHARANRQKPSGIAAKETILNRHLIPMLGDEEARRDHQRGRAATEAQPEGEGGEDRQQHADRAERAAEEGRGVGCDRATPVLHPAAAGSDNGSAVPRFRRATSGWCRRLIGWVRESYLVVLLGGDAGLRLGEIMALEWRDVDLQKRQLCVERSDWKGQVTTTKGGGCDTCR